MKKIAYTFQQLIQALIHNKRYWTILLLGFSSGLPAALTASTLQAWFTETGISLQAIGAVTLLVLPYSIRFLWAPIFDHFKIPLLDRRRGWLLLTQIGLIIAISTMALFTPREILQLHSWSIPWLMILGFITATLSTSQDIVINAYQIEILPENEQGLGAAIYSAGWRIGAIISSAIALILAKELGWKETYLLMASLMSIGVLATCLGPKTIVFQQPSVTLFHAVISPIQDFFQRYGLKTASLFLLLIMTYKVGDALALALNTTFLLRYIGFDLALIGSVNKTISLVSALLGGLAAGILMTRISLYRALMIFGLIQATANLSYAIMAYYGKSLLLLILTAFTENFCSGMGTIALLAFIMALCNTRYTATQFALFSAIAFLARTIAGPTAAIMIDSIGWTWFFTLCFVVSLPTLLLVNVNKNAILQLRNSHQTAAQQ